MTTTANEHAKSYTAAIIGVGAAQPVTPGSTVGGFQIGYLHANMYRSNPRIELVAAADINAYNLQAFQSSFGVALGFDDYRVMLQQVKPDIVSICTYVGLHRAMIEDAARAGVQGIICEKPFLASPTDCGLVRQVAQETGVKIVVPHFRRYLPVFARAQQLYTGGAVGEPVICIAGIEGWELSEWGSHWLDMFRFFHNDRPVKWVFGQVRVCDRRGFGHAMEEHGVAYFEFEGGGKGLLDGGHRMAGDATMTLVGAEGTIRIVGAALHVDTAGRQSESFADHPLSGTLPAWGRMLEDFVIWLDGGPEPMLGLSSMLKTSELNLAAYLSALRGDRIDLPLRDTTDEWPVEILARRSRADRHT